MGISDRRGSGIGKYLHRLYGNVHVLEAGMVWYKPFYNLDRCIGIIFWCWGRVDR